MSEVTIIQDVKTHSIVKLKRVKSLNKAHSIKFNPLICFRLTSSRISRRLELDQHARAVQRVQRAHCQGALPHRRLRQVHSARIAVTSVHRQSAQLGLNAAQSVASLLGHLGHAGAALQGLSRLQGRQALHAGRGLSASDPREAQGQLFDRGRHCDHAVPHRGQPDATLLLVMWCSLIFLGDRKAFSTHIHFIENIFYRKF